MAALDHPTTGAVTGESLFSLPLSAPRLRMCAAYPYRATGCSEALFTATLGTLYPAYRETAESNFLAIARRGVSTEYLFLTCYADYTAAEYLLGDGPTALTLAYDRMGEAHSYELYRREHDAGQFGGEPLKSEGEHEAELDETVWAAESSIGDIIEGRESVLFLAPMGAHNAIAVEAWQVVAQWDVQRGEDGVVNAVRYGAPAHDAEHTQTLAGLRSRITTGALPEGRRPKLDHRVRNSRCSPYGHRAAARDKLRLQGAGQGDGARYIDIRHGPWSRPSSGTTRDTDASPG